MLDRNTLERLAFGGEYKETLAALTDDFRFHSSTESFDTLLWICNVLGESPMALALAVTRDPKFMTADAYFEVGIALYKAFQTNILIEFGLYWHKMLPDDYRPLTLLAYAELQRKQDQRGRTYAMESLKRNDSQWYLRNVAVGEIESSRKDHQRFEHSHRPYDLVLLTRLLRESAASEKWKETLDVSDRILDLAPKHPMAAQMKAKSLRNLYSASIAFEYSHTRFMDCHWYEPFYAQHCQFSKLSKRYIEIAKSIVMYGRSRSQLRSLGESIICTFKPVALVSSVTGWHDF